MKNNVSRIVIRGTSGYWRNKTKAFHDKITIDKESIQYEYEPKYKSEANPARQWAYTNTSPDFQKLFMEACEAVGEILSRQDEPNCTDLGVTIFEVTYVDNKTVERSFILPRGDFKACFDIIKKMVPATEFVPAVLGRSLGTKTGGKHVQNDS